MPKYKVAMTCVHVDIFEAEDEYSAVFQMEQRYSAGLDDWEEVEVEEIEE